MRDGVAGQDRALVDPNELDRSGLLTIDWYYPSPDARLVAVALHELGHRRVHLARVAGDRSVLGHERPEKRHQLAPPLVGVGYGTDMRLYRERGRVRRIARDVDDPGALDQAGQRLGDRGIEPADGL